MYFDNIKPYLYKNYIKTYKYTHNTSDINIKITPNIYQNLT